MILICTVIDRYALTESADPEHKNLDKKKHKLNMSGNIYSLSMPKSSTENIYKGTDTYASIKDGEAGAVYRGADTTHVNSGYVASDEEDAAVKAHDKFTDLEGG